MSHNVPAPFEALFVDPGDGDRAAVELMCTLADSRGDVTLEVDGTRVALPASLRGLLQRAAGHLRRGDDIRRSLGHEPARILLQPIVDLRSGSVAGFEALSDVGSRDLRGADSWFRDAAILGLDEQFELLLLALALDELDALPSDAYLSVNVSPAALLSPALGSLLRGVEARRVVLEITEHSPVTDYAALNAALRRLRRRGVRVAVDDAGAGYASLNHILLLHPDIVKLDASLIHDITSDGARQSLVRGLCAFTEEIGAVCVAEGVETARQLAVLRDAGVGFGQGWLLGPPRHRDERSSAPRRTMSSAQIGGKPCPSRVCG